MTREIKFRAWDGERMRDMFSISAYGEILMGGEEYPSWKVMQFCGLKDKNGKEVYEGDIVRITNPEKQIQKKSIISEIGFYDYSFCAYWRKTEIWERYNVAPSSIYFLNCLIGSDQIEIIGNIYENPELLNS